MLTPMHPVLILDAERYHDDSWASHGLKLSPGSVGFAYDPGSARLWAVGGERKAKPLHEVYSLRARSRNGNNTDGDGGGGGGQL